MYIYTLGFIWNRSSSCSCRNNVTVFVTIVTTCVVSDRINNPSVELGKLAGMLVVNGLRGSSKRCPIKDKQPLKYSFNKTVNPEI